MDIKKIAVKGLFHTFDHEISFKSGKIVIVIGENGIGKTTILQIINSIFTKKFDFLYSIDFETIEIEFSKGKWTISKDKVNNIIINKIGEKKPFVIKPINDRDSIYVRRFIVQISENEWFDRRLGGRLTREEVIQRYGRDPLMQPENMPKWFEETITNNRIIFIKTQRLYKTEYEGDRDVKELEYMVKTYSNDLVNLLQQNNAVFTSTSIQLDSTFPVRLLKELGKTKKAKGINTIINNISELIDYRNLLSSVGIIDKQEDEFISNSLENLNDNSALSILSLYISDNKQKLEVFDKTARKLDILLKVINKRCKHKKLSIDKNKGFIISSKYEDRTIDVEKLSSGEQNELIIFYNLLFKTNSNDLVLIDEPEISLHIAWQQKLISDLKEIADETGISLLVSTHSPDIIGDNWNLVQTLSGKE